MEKLTLIKVGGKIVEDDASLKKFLNKFSKVEGHKVLVHGGGRTATQIASKLGIESVMVGGRRITDIETLKVVTMVYAGLVNKSIVASLQALGLNSTGLTGADLNYMISEKRPVGEIDYGYVGDVKKVNAEILAELISKNVIPVLAPLTHDGQGNMLNTNADTIASEAAKALSKYFEVSLVYCFEKKGVLYDENNEDSVIEEITKEKFGLYVKEGIINGGMIPKLENAYNAISAGVKEVIITSADSIASGVSTRVI